jgi:hypothetical protein
MKSVKGTKITVQGDGSPVPAAKESEQAGSQSSRPSYCNDTVVANLATVPANTSSANETNRTRDLLNPFKGMTKVNRSPPRGKNMVPKESSHDSARITPVVQPSRNSPKREDPLYQLGCKTEELQSMMVDRRSIHQPLRDLVNCIEPLQNQAMNEKISTTENTAANVSQFSPTPKKE